MKEPHQNAEDRQEALEQALAGDYLKITVDFPYGFWGKEARRNSRLFLRSLDQAKTALQLDELIEGATIPYVGIVFQSELAKERRAFGSVGQLSVIVAGSPAYLEACKAATLTADADISTSTFEVVNHSKYDLEIQTEGMAWCQELRKQAEDIAREENCTLRASHIWLMENSDREVDYHYFTVSVSGDILPVLRCQERLQSLPSSEIEVKSSFFFYDKNRANTKTLQEKTAEEAAQAVVARANS